MKSRATQSFTWCLLITMMTTGVLGRIRPDATQREGGDLGQSCAVLLKKNKIQDFIFIVSSIIVGYERFVFRFVSFVLRF